MKNTLQIYYNYFNLQVFPLVLYQYLTLLINILTPFKIY